MVFLSSRLFALRAILGAFLFAPVVATALQVRPDKPFHTITAAVVTTQPGSTIEIDGGIHLNETITIGKDSLTPRGVGRSRNMKSGTGEYLANAANSGNERAIFIISARNATIENLESPRAKVVGQDCARMHYEGGNLTIRGSYFDNNEIGIYGSIQ